ncbi:MAG: cytochrome c biogenesis CcdA family protein [Anaerolineales bacterium]|nr:cytochrome c biogenesis CcdA family protein [Anaerolineales bacterium]
MDFDFQILQDASLLGFLLTFLGGVVTSLGPCNLTAIPLVIGFVGGSGKPSRQRSFQISLSFAVGLAVTFMLLGVGAALAGGLIGLANSIWYYLVAAVCFLVGLSMMGVLTIPLPGWFSDLRERVARRGVPGALLLGLVSGLVTSQCATPVLAAVLTYVMLKGAITYGALLLFVYALGRGVPIVLAGTFTGVLANFQKLGKWSEGIEKVSGVIIIAVGFYFFWIA